jgi:proteasome lid subunit RPN8/RPN11
MNWFRRLFSRSGEAGVRSVSKVFLCESVVRESERVLRASHDNPTELVAYWFGHNAGSEWVVTTCVVPAADARRGGFSTSRAANAEVVLYAADHRLCLLAQIHTHPGSFVDHSDIDIERAFMPFENYLSIVVPHYCWQGILPLSQCGVHRFEQGRFNRLGARDTTELFQMIPTVKNFRSE